MQLSVLGPFEARVAGRRVDLRPAERRLLAALTVARSGLSYDELADALWSDDVPATAVHSLQTHVARVRAAVGRDCVVTVDGGYRLGRCVAVDADAFAEAVRTAGQANSRRGSGDLWEHALALWRGRPLRELADWYPASVERARLEELFMVADEERCAQAVDDHPTVSVVADARSLVEAEQLRERRWAILISALAATGRRAEALRTFDRARRVLATELGISPGRELTNLHEALVRADDRVPDGTRPFRAPAHQLPAPTSSLVGRDDLLAAVRRRLAEHRCVTLTGPGGIGKTRVATEVAAHAATDGFGDLVFIELASVNRTDEVDKLVGAAADAITPPRGTVRETIAQSLEARPVLLLMDNCEHVIDAVADLLGELLRRCPKLTVLATSRQPLGVDGEQVISVPPLPTDETIDLLVERATASGASIRAADDEALTAVSTLVSGIPLAIELAASHVRSLGLSNVAARLADQIDIGATRRSSALSSHQTMRRSIAWSYELLTPAERHVFAHLSVFAGPFDLAAASYVSDHHQGDVDPAVVISSLVDKSMVMADRDEQVVYRLLYPIRTYAAEQLAELGSTTEALNRHTAYYAERVEQWSGDLHGPHELVAVRQLNAARSELRSVFTRAVAEGDANTALRVAVSVGWLARTHILLEPWAWCETAIGLPGARDHPLRAWALVHASEGAWQRGHHQQAVDWADQAIEMSQRGDEVWLEAHRARAAPLIWLGRLDDAIESSTIAARSEPGSRPGLLSMSREATRLLILNLSGHREPGAALPLVDSAQRIANPTGIALAHHVAGVLLAHEDQPVAMELQRMAATLAAESGATLIEGFALAALAASGPDDDPIRSARATIDVMAHYQRAGNHAHLRSFARSLGETFHVLGDLEAVEVIEAATRGEPSLVPRHPAPHAGPALSVGAIRAWRMTDEDFVQWLDHRLTSHDAARTRTTST